MYPSYRNLLQIICLSIVFANGVCWRVIGGRPAKEGEFPYQVSLRRSYNDEHFCGGSIISPWHILTAAHCMYYRWGGVLPPITVSVVAGQIDHPITDSTVYRNVSRITIHEDFEFEENEAHDIAILELSSALPLDSNKLIAQIPIRNELINSGKCIVSGWGVVLQGSKIVSETLLAANVDVLDFSVCKEKYMKADVELQEGMLCAGKEEGGKDACKGDSGGALVCNGLLTGIISTGKGCGQAEFPGIYTDVARYLTWIQNTLEIPLIETTTVVFDNDTTVAETTSYPDRSNTVEESEPNAGNTFSVTLNLLIFECVQIILTKIVL